MVFHECDYLLHCSVFSTKVQCQCNYFGHIMQCSKHICTDGIWQLGIRKRLKKKTDLFALELSGGCKNVATKKIHFFFFLLSSFIIKLRSQLFAQKNVLLDKNQEFKNAFWKYFFLFPPPLSLSLSLSLPHNNTLTHIVSHLYFFGLQQISALKLLLSLPLSRSLKNWNPCQEVFLNFLH